LIVVTATICCIVAILAVTILLPPSFVFFSGLIALCLPYVMTWTTSNSRNLSFSPVSPATVKTDPGIELVFVVAYFSVYRINGLDSIPDLYAFIVYVTSKVLKLQGEFWIEVAILAK
jgi:hypothetical protein